MKRRLDITIDLILHATEDLSKFFKIFEEDFGIKKETFSLQNTIGHFDNPIIRMHAKITKKDAQLFFDKILEKTTQSQKEDILSDIDKTIDNSSLHLRFDKQRFLDGQLEIQQKDAIKIKIFTPNYNKEDISKIFSELLMSHH